MPKRKKKATDERLIVWRNGRAYGDFRSYEDVGGGREALSEPGRTWATKDPEIANVLYDTRLSEPRSKRKGRLGASGQERTTLDELIREHLLRKARADISDAHMQDLEIRIGVALDMALVEGEADDVPPSRPRDLTVEEVAEQMQVSASAVRRWLISAGLRGYKLNDKARAESFRDPEWLANQDASEAGVLHGILSYKAVRLLEGLEGSGVQRTDPTTNGRRNRVAGHV